MQSTFGHEQQQQQQQHRLQYHNGSAGSSSEYVAKSELVAQVPQPTLPGAEEYPPDQAGFSQVFLSLDDIAVKDFSDNTDSLFILEVCWCRQQNLRVGTLLVLLSTISMLETAAGITSRTFN